MEDLLHTHTAELSPGTQNGPKLRGLFVWYEYLMMSQFACPGLFSITMQGSPYLGDLQRYLKTWLSASSSSSWNVWQTKQGNIWRDDNTTGRRHCNTNRRWQGNSFPSQIRSEDHMEKGRRGAREHPEWRPCRNRTLRRVQGMWSYCRTTKYTRNTR